MANEYVQMHILTMPNTHTLSCCGKTESSKTLLHSGHLLAASNHLDTGPTASPPFS